MTHYSTRPDVMDPNYPLPQDFRTVRRDADCPDCGVRFSQKVAECPSAFGDEPRIIEPVCPDCSAAREARWADEDRQNTSTTRPIISPQAQSDDQRIDDWIGQRFREHGLKARFTAQDVASALEWHISKVKRSLKHAVYRNQLEVVPRPGKPTIYRLEL